MSPNVQRVVEHVRQTEGWYIGFGGLRRRGTISAWAGCPLASWRDSHGEHGSYVLFTTDKMGLAMDEVYLVMNAADSGERRSKDAAVEEVRVALLLAAGKL